MNGRPELLEHLQRYDSSALNRAVQKSQMMKATQNRALIRHPASEKVLDADTYRA